MDIDSKDGSISCINKQTKLICHCSNCTVVFFSFTTDRSIYKKISLEDKYQWHKFELRTKPPRCNKNKLRSLEVKCQQQKFRESKKDAVRCTDITNVVTDALNSR